MARSDRMVAYRPKFAKIAGGALAGLFLSQVFYWSQRTTLKGDWFYKTAEEWEEETGLTRSQQATARAKLRDVGLIEEHRHSIPAKLHYRLNKDRLQELIERDSFCLEPESRARESEDLPEETERQVCRISATNTETTLKDYSETTHTQESERVNPEIREEAKPLENPPLVSSQITSNEAKLVEGATIPPAPKNFLKRIKTLSSEPKFFEAVRRYWKGVNPHSILANDESLIQIESHVRNVIAKRENLKIQKYLECFDRTTGDGVKAKRAPQVQMIIGLDGMPMEWIV